MYQIHMGYSGERAFEDALDKLQARLAASECSAILFHILNASTDAGASLVAADAISRRFPQAPYLGCSSNANISDGALAADEGALLVICDVFEDPDTRIELMQVSLDFGREQQAAAALLDALAAHPETKAVEMLTTVESASMPKFCQAVSAAPAHVVLFGGGSVSPDTNFADVSVFSSDGSSTNHGVVFVRYSGRNFHAQTKVLQGWKPLGMSFHITRADRMTLYELNGNPAFETYNHYLQIADDDDFLQNGLCFPLSIDCYGTQVLRTPIATGPEGALIVPADISDEHGECRIAYGDPTAILANVEECAAGIREFRPQAILAFSCAARLMYWGREYANRETLPFQGIAPTAGFYTGGELARYRGNLLHHNLTLVLVGLREGDPDPAAAPAADDRVQDPMAMSLQLSLIGRMASFIGAASEELQEAYERMEAIARTDGLTGLANRREVERVMMEAVKAHEAHAKGPGEAAPGEAAPGNVVPGAAGEVGPGAAGEAPSVLMFDLDDFKKINDTCGHEAGDDVLRRMADMLRRDIADGGYRATPGRWGGEEFMVVLPDSGIQAAARLAETLRAHFAQLDFPCVGHCTMSIGVAQLREGETFDQMCSRVDHALYRAKDLGKNRVVVDR